MSVKVLNAQVTDGKVIVDNQEVDAEILGDGGDSTGFVFFDNDVLKYIPKPTGDLSDVIEMLNEILNKISQIAEGLDGVTNAPGGQAVNITALNNLISEFNQKKDDLV